MHLPTDPKDYIMQSFKDDLNCYTISIETDGNGFVIEMEYNPDYPTPRLTKLLQSVEVPSGYFLCYYDGHDGKWLLLHHGSKVEAKATYKRLYMRYYRYQVYMCIIKV